MSKSIFFLLIFTAAALFLVIRCRRQIVFLIRLYRMVRGNPESLHSVGDRAVESDVKLVKCGSCGKWVADDRAVKFPGGIAYCGISCSGSDRVVETVIKG